ncbi:hypothetical protein D3C81_1428400 [compost metagenome]
MSAVVLLQKLRAELHGHPSCHFAHWCKQRQCASIHNSFVADREDAFVFQCGCEGWFWSKVQIREQDQTRTEVAVFAFQRLFYLHDHFSGSPYSSCVCNQLSSGCSILFVQKSAACAGSGFHQHFMSFSHQADHSGRGNCYAVFVILNFFRYANDHC